jgi:hypothetical protein
MYLSLCLIIKNENSYLKEWLDYHILLGVEHFWIYDNESDIPVATSLDAYIQSGWVTVNTITGKSKQLYAYDHCIQTYGTQSKWIGFIDTDEFIVLRDCNDLREYLKAFESFSGLAISSLFFGYGGNKTQPRGGQIAGYRIRTKEQFSRNRLIKSIIQPEKVIFPVSPHSFFYKEGFYCVNEKGSRVDIQQFPCHVDSIQVNHYFTRSEEEWNKKLSRGRGDAGNSYSNEPGVLVNEYSLVEDVLILERLKELTHQTFMDTSTWQKITSPNSTQLLNLLHQTAKQFTPPPYPKQDPLDVHPRPELMDYMNKMDVVFDLIKTGKTAEIRDIYASEITKYPFDIVRLANFGAICIQLQDFQTAWTALAQAWRLAPRSLYVLLIMIEYFYAIGDFPQAERTSLLAASQGELEPLGVAKLALSQWKQGKYDEAKKTARPLLAQLTVQHLNEPLFKELADLILQ